MSNPYAALRERSQQTAAQFQLCHDIEGALALVELVESMVALSASFTPAEQLEFARLVKAILACQERQDWLGLADYLAWEWSALLTSVEQRQITSAAESP